MLKKSIERIPMENCIEYIQTSLNFYNYSEIKISENMDYFIVGNDIDSRGVNSYRIKGHPDVFYGNGILVKIPKSINFHKLLNTKITVEDFEKLIVFY